MSSECAVCFLPYDSVAHCPRILPCGHTLCTLCVTQLLRNGAVVCPNDRRESALANVESLPKNFALLEVVQQSEKDAGKCVMCDQDPHMWCMECKHYYCNDDLSRHLKVGSMRDHQAIPLAELKANPTLANAVHVCAEHNDPYRFYDLECKRLVCRDCVTLEHHGHKCETIGNAARRVRNDLAQMVLDAGQVVGMFDTVDNDCAEMISKLDENLAASKNSINDFFEELRLHAESRQLVLLAELDKAYHTKRKPLIEAQRHLQTQRLCIASAAQHARALSSSTLLPSASSASAASASSGSTTTAEDIKLLSGHSALATALKQSGGGGSSGGDDGGGLALLPGRATASFISAQLPGWPVLEAIASYGTVLLTTFSVPRCSASGPGVCGQVDAGQVRFLVNVRDGDGAGVAGVADRVCVRVACANGGANPAVAVEDAGGGAYAASYVLGPEAAGGGCEVRVLVGGEHVPGSPFAVTVRVRDLSWMDTSGPVGGVRCVPNTRLALAVSRTNVHSGRQYDAPSGYRWATQAEFEAEAAGAPDSQPMKGQFGWAGYTWNGLSRYYFIVRDSLRAMHAGGSLRTLSHTYTLNGQNFAGIICIREETAGDR